MLTFVGLGLYDEHSVTLAGRDAIAAADRVLAEFYTSVLAGTTVPDLEAAHGVDVEVLDREVVEGDQGSILAAAETGDVAFLTGGDPMIATTHVDLRVRAAERGIETRVVHGTTAGAAAASLSGLQNYRFGKATTLPFPDVHGGSRGDDAGSRGDGDGRRGADDPGRGEARRASGAVGGDADDVPESVLSTIRANRELGLHTLVFLDIAVDSEDGDDGPVAERFMTADHAASLLAPAVDAPGVVVARAGSRDPVVAADRLAALADRSFGGPLHLLVVPGDLHVVEWEALQELAGAPPSALPEPV